MYVVDLDNSLVATDLLYETFFAYFSREPISALRAFLEVKNGGAALKARLADRANLDVSRLPYNPDVLASIAEVRRAGGKVALVSASDQRLVDAIAAHLGCFDEAHGSDGTRNLKGEVKARFLVERYGSGRFDYVGDSAADLAVWKHARRAITIGAPDWLRAEVDRTVSKAEHFPGPKREGSRWRPYLKAMRPHQWVKNLLVFLPAVAAHESGVEVWLSALVAFIVFSLTASSVYVLNDLLDLSADRAHPHKKERPFASGAVSIAHGLVLAPSLLALAILLASIAASPLFLLVLALYYILTLAYSLTLKRRLVIDICTLAGLYTLRVIAGGAATGLPLSAWLLGFSIFLFLSLAAIKRQAELVKLEKLGTVEAPGRAYEVGDLSIVAMMAIASGYVAVLVLALYINSSAVQLLYKSPLILWSACPILIYWISRSVMIAHRGAMADDPVVFAMRDRVSLMCGAGIVAVALAGSFL